MPSLKVAHIHEQGVDLVIVPLDIGFGDRPHDVQVRTIAEIQETTQRAGLKGDVIPVWDSGAGCMSFIAPQNYHPYFNSLSLDTVYQNLNRELRW
jgi:hypothetical protein